MSKSTVKSLLVAGVAALAIGTSSCALGVPALVEGASDPQPRPSATEASTQSYDPMDSSPSDAASTEEAAPEDTEYRFGDTVEYADGLEVTLSKLKTFKPTEYSIHGSEDKFVAFTVTVKNGTGKLYDPSSFYTTATTGDDESEQVFDSEQDFNAAPSTKLRAGKTVKFKIGYGVNKNTDFVVEVSPGYTSDEEDSYNSVLFVGAVK